MCGQYFASKIELRFLRRIKRIHHIPQCRELNCISDFRFQHNKHLRLNVLASQTGLTDARVHIQGLTGALSY